MVPSARLHLGSCKVNTASVLHVDNRGQLPGVRRRVRLLACVWIRAPREPHGSAADMTLNINKFLQRKCRNGGDSAWISDLWRGKQISPENESNRREPGTIGLRAYFALGPE